MRALAKLDTAIAEKQDSIMRRIVRWDGWENILTGLGMMGRDKRLSATPQPTFLTQQDVENIYQSDDIAARIVDRPVDEMMREGFCIKIEGGKDVEEEIMSEYRRLLIPARLNEAKKWARIYGGAGLIMGVETTDNNDPALPLNRNNIKRISYCVGVDRYRLFPGGNLISDPTSPEFLLPERYQIMRQDGQTQVSSLGDNVIHHSRVIRLDGNMLPWNMRRQNQFWGASIYVRLFNALRNFQTGHDSVATIIQEFTQMIFKMKDLRDMLTQGKDNLIMQKFALAARMSSIVNAIVIQEGEEIEKKSTNVTGLSDLMRIVNNRLVAATDMPHTILLGESADGLGATGASEKRDWYDHIKGMQEAELTPILKNIIDLICLQKEGPTKGVIPKYSIEYKPLWQMDLKDIVAIRKTQAEADEIYIRNTVVDPQEIAVSRFSENGYSIETEIDLEARALLEKKIEESPQDKEEDDDELGDE